MEFDRGREQRIEPRVREQVERSGHPAGQCPTGAVRRCDPTDLTGYQLEAATMERPAKRDSDFVRAIPTQLQHRRLITGEAKRGCKTGGGPAGMDDEVTIAGRRTGCGEADTELAGKLGTGRLDVDQSYLGAGELSAQPGDQRPDHAGTHHRDT